MMRRSVIRHAMYLGSMDIKTFDVPRPKHMWNIPVVHGMDLCSPTSRNFRGR